jgi:DNA polymerase-3 subunit alpha
VAPVLGVTRGLLFYPEQLVQLSIAVAGYAPADAQALCDALQRRRIGELVRHRARFLAGALERGVPLADAEIAFEALLHFSNFDFDRAHATTTALLGYHAAYLRTHEGAAWAVAALRRPGGAERVRAVIGDALAHDVRVLPVDVNRSDWEYAVDGGAVRVGLVQVRGLGEPAARRLLEARRRDGFFASIGDLRARVPELGVPALVALAKAGAFDAVAGARSAALRAVEAAGAAPAGQLELSFDAEPGLLPAEDMPAEQRQELEREVLGVSLHADPMLRQAPAWARLDLVPSARLADDAVGAAVRVGGRVRRVVETRTRRGEPMAFVELADPWGDYEVVLFPGAFARAPRAVLAPQSLVQVTGVLEHGRGRMRVRGEDVQSLSLEAARIVPFTPAKTAPAKTADVCAESPRSTSSASRATAAGAASPPRRPRAAGGGTPRRRAS